MFKTLRDSFAGRRFRQAASWKVLIDAGVRDVDDLCFFTRAQVLATCAQLCIVDGHIFLSAVASANGSAFVKPTATVPTGTNASEPIDLSKAHAAAAPPAPAAAPRAVNVAKPPTVPGASSTAPIDLSNAFDGAVELARAAAGARTNTERDTAVFKSLSNDPGYAAERGSWITPFSHAELAAVIPEWTSATEVSKQLLTRATHRTYVASLCELARLDTAGGAGVGRVQAQYLLRLIETDSTDPLAYVPHRCAYVPASMASCASGNDSMDVALTPVGEGDAARALHPWTDLVPHVPSAAALISTAKTAINARIDGKAIAIVAAHAASPASCGRVQFACKSASSLRSALGVDAPVVANFIVMAVDDESPLTQRAVGRLQLDPAKVRSCADQIAKLSAGWSAGAPLPQVVVHVVSPHDTIESIAVVNLDLGDGRVSRQLFLLASSALPLGTSTEIARASEGARPKKGRGTSRGTKRARSLPPRSAELDAAHAANTWST